MKKNILFLSVVLICTLIFSQLSAAENYEYSPPVEHGDGIPVSTIQAENMNQQLITKATQSIIGEKYEGIHSILVLKNGKLVYENYFQGFDETMFHRIFSISKSVTSILIGIAIDQGFIESVDAPLYSFFPEYPEAMDDPRKEKLTLRHVLTMTAGYDWDEWTHSYSEPENTETQMVSTKNWVKFLLCLPMKYEPGEEWIYNTGSIHCLGAVINKATGMNTDKFAEKYLFEPLGIENYSWNKDYKGFVAAGGTWGGLRLRSRDLAKIGILFRDKGVWDGKRVVSEKWVTESTKHQTGNASDREFGYLWWRGNFELHGKSYDHYYGAGYGGQSLHYCPELDIMIIITSWGREQDADILGPTLMIYNAAVKGK